MSAPRMDSSPTPRSREIAQRLFQKNLELEETRRKALKLRIPSDQSSWGLMRDNFETILLEDHDFAEKHGVEYSLWQLHHRKIDEYRAHLSAASATTEGGKVSTRPDRTKRIFSGFKSFLSEASGFYHDLILKIRAKYGLPLGYFSEDSENQIIMSKDDKRSIDIKKALISCHRCLIFLGDLSRYKGMYGDGDSSNRDYAAASSYYLQAASIWPSSGNPHHQLAILSICTDDNELTTIYRYFRSLAVESPLLTARDNLIVAFEKNRQKCSQLSDNSKTAFLKMVPTQFTGKGRSYLSKYVKTEETQASEREISIPETFNLFCTRFVRLNGILYTRTSLETFEDIFSSVVNDLSKLLSSGPLEELNFGSDSAENGMIIVKIITILIFSVHNVSNESVGQSYAEILQRSVLLQNAFTSSFKFLGLILKRCGELQDVPSSCLLPGILVFIEWLACHPDIASGIDVDEKQTPARSFFWNHFVSLMNKLLLSGLASFGGDDDETCFFDMSRYDEGETENRLALWEDIELRGFVPLVPAQLILDFSIKRSFGNEMGIKEKKSRVQRILAAGRSLMNMVQINHQNIHYNSKMKKYVIGDYDQTNEDKFPVGYPDFSKTNGFTPVCSYSIDNTVDIGAFQSKAQFLSEGEEEDEVIVFKPTVADKFSNSLKPTDCDAIQLAEDEYPTDLKPVGYETFSPLQSSGDLESYHRPISVSLTSMPHNIPTASSHVHATAVSVTHQHLLPGSGSTYMKLASVSDLKKPLQSVSNSSSDVNSTQQPLQNASHATSTIDTLQQSLQSVSYGSSALNTLQQPLQCASRASSALNVLQQPLQYVNPITTRWLMDQEIFFSDRLNNLKITDDGYDTGAGMWQGLSAVQPSFSSNLFSGSAVPVTSNLVNGQIKVGETTLPSNLHSVVSSGIGSENFVSSSSTLPITSRKNPVERPIRHFGPPPGFNSVPSRQLDETVSTSSWKDDQNNLVDDYSWLDGYSTDKSEATKDSLNFGAHSHSHVSSGINGSLGGAMNFPFPGKQLPSFQPPQMECSNGWQDYQLIQSLKLYADKQAQQGNQQSGSVLDEAQPLWHNRYFV